MPLNLPRRAACFVDANIFVYPFVEFLEFAALSTACQEFLRKLFHLEIDGASTATCLADAVHRVMAIEAQEKFGLPSGAVAWLQRHPERIAELSAFRDAAKQLHALPLRLLPTDSEIVLEAAELSGQYGLLTNDAMVVALMRRHGLTDLVTNDDDFDKVPGLTVWKPR